MRRYNLHLVPSLTDAGFTRREALASMAAAVAAGCAPKTGPSGDSGAVIPATIDHIIVVMFENRSFDHFLGALKLEEGRAVDGLDATMSNPDADGNPIAVHPAAVQCLFDPPHGWNSSHLQWNGGANDRFVTEYIADGAPNPAEVMGYMTRADLPVSYALADAYTVCDRYFCSVMGPTWPNRFYGHAGTSEGQDDNNFPEGGAFTFPTVWNKLDEAGVAWKYYYTDLPFIGLFENGLKPGFYGMFEDFLYDCANGLLPAVSWVDPGFSYNDDHPPHFVGLGQEFLGMLYQALATSPQWNRCLLLVTYDEHGGFFDHVPPPTTEDDYAADGFDQMGFRIPVLAVGPFVKAGVVSDTLDNTSWLKLVCERFGITPWTKRIEAATSLAVVLDADRMAADQPNPPAEVPLPDYDDDALGAECFGGGLGPTAPPPGTGPKRGLIAWIGQHYPHLDRRGDVVDRFAKLRKVFQGR